MGLAKSQAECGKTEEQPSAAKATKQEKEESSTGQQQQEQQKQQVEDVPHHWLPEAPPERGMFWEQDRLLIHALS